MTKQLELNTPWTLEFDRDGTEDIATICDASGATLTTSRPFWLPEGDDPEPATLAAMRVMTAAPSLLETLSSAERFVSGFEGDELQEGIDELLKDIRAAISQATKRSF